MSQSAALQLTDQQTELVRLIAREGVEIKEAGRRAGYSSSSVYSVIKRPAVVFAIHEAIQSDLISVAAPLAFRVAKSLLADEQVSARVRADIAFKFMDRAGHITPSNKAKPAQKALSEMTREEMLEFIDRNQAEIDKIESELAERATVVSSPDKPPMPATIDAKPLSFLD